VHRHCEQSLRSRVLGRACGVKPVRTAMAGRAIPRLKEQMEVRENITIRTFTLRLLRYAPRAFGLLREFPLRSKTLAMTVVFTNSPIHQLTNN
jgi:hypothetical protein